MIDQAHEHGVKIGESGTVNTLDHPQRTESPAFNEAKGTAHKIIALAPKGYWQDNPQMHHGGSIWVHDGQQWRLFLNTAGIEWSMQFCCDPAKVEKLRQNVVAILAAFPQSEAEYAKLGYKDYGKILEPITDAAGVAWFTDSIFNSCVPLDQPHHTGSLTSGDHQHAGAHNYPKPPCDAQELKFDDFVLWHNDGGSAVAVVPVAPRGSGDGRVEVVHAEADHPTLHKAMHDAHADGKQLVLPADHPLAQAAFAKQS